MTTPQRLSRAAGRAEAAELAALRLECQRLRIENERLARLNRELLGMADRFRLSHRTVPAITFRWETPA